jgi:hypothetical protein
VRLGQPEAAAQQLAVEGWGVDLEHRAQRLGRIERAEARRRAVALAQLEDAAARQAQQPKDESARKPAPHRRASRGRPKYGARLSFRRAALA